MKLNRNLAKKIMLVGVSILSTCSLVISVASFYKVNNFDRPPKHEKHDHGVQHEMKCNHDHEPKHEHGPKHDHKPGCDHEAGHDHKHKCDHESCQEHDHEHGPSEKKGQEPAKDDFSKEKEAPNTTSEEEKKN